MTPWFLEVYDKTGDELLVSEHLLVGVTTEDVRAITGASANDSMYAALSCRTRIASGLSARRG